MRSKLDQNEDIVLPQKHLDVQLWSNLRSVKWKLLCIGNWATRAFSKYSNLFGKSRQLQSNHYEWAHLNLCKIISQNNTALRLTEKQSLVFYEQHFRDFHSNHNPDA